MRRHPSEESQGDANGSIVLGFAKGLAGGTTSKGIEFTARRVHG